MRRLWAHIIIAFAAIVAVFATVPSLIKGISSDGNYETRRQFTFQLKEREQLDESDDPKELGVDSAKEMAKIMEERLLNYNVSSFDITTGTTYAEDTAEAKSIGDMITITFSASSSEKYAQIVHYLTFSGSFAFVNSNNDLVESDLFRDGDAYLKNSSVNEFPAVIFPVKTDSTEWEALVQGAIDNPVTQEATEEGGESTSKAQIILLYNYQKGDTYETLQESNKLAEKTFYTFEFDPEDKDSLYYDSDKNSVYETCGYSDANGNGTADPSEVRSAFDKADYDYLRYNASALDYEIKCIGGLESGSEVWIDAKVEPIVKEGKIIWNSTLTAALAAIVIVSLLMVVFYRLGALSGLICTLVTTFLSLGFMVLAGVEYGALTVVALVLVATVSLISSIIYNNKLKEDAYRGHTLKKANTEASKKSLLPIIDIHVVALLIGLMSFLLGGAALHAFGAILSIGSIISFVISLIGLKGMMWLVTNTTKLNGQYQLFGIDPNNVPNHLAEEKQRYFGPYADKDLTKKKKPVGITGLAAFGLALIGIIVSASIQSGSIYRTPAAKVVSNEILISNKIVYVDDSSTSPLNDTTLYSDILDTIKLESKDAESDKLIYTTKLSTLVDSFESYEVKESITVEGDVTTTYLTTYYVVKLNKIVDKKQNCKVDGDETVYALSEAIDNYFDIVSLYSAYENSMSLKDVETFAGTASPDWQKITLATCIAMVIATLYFVLRYRLARGLTSLIFPVATSAISLGLIALLSAIGASLPATVGIVLPIVTLFSYIFSVLFMNRERELIADDKTRDVSYEHREELSIKAMGMAYTPILASAVIGIYLLINFFGFGPASSSYLYLFGIVGALIVLGLITVLYVPISNYLLKKFSSVKRERKPKEGKKNKKQQVVKKSAEPEEAIFIGIND